MKIRTGRIFALPIAVALLSVGACAQAETGHVHTTAPVTPSVSSTTTPGALRHADVIGLDGKSLGSIILQDTPAGVLVSANVAGIPAGDHGFHFHQKGLCDPSVKFESAGGHFAAGDHQHGYMTANGPHGGDMPNQHVGTDGVLKTQILNTGVTYAPGAKSLFDADGTALVIHAAADDYTSQPSGNAGARIACAVISPAQ